MLHKWCTLYCLIVKSLDLTGKEIFHRFHPPLPISIFSHSFTQISRNVISLLTKIPANPKQSSRAIQADCISSFLTKLRIAEELSCLKMEKHFYIGNHVYTTDFPVQWELDLWYRTVYNLINKISSVSQVVFLLYLLRLLMEYQAASSIPTKLHKHELAHKCLVLGVL